MILMQVFINIQKFKFWKHELNRHFPEIVSKMEQIIWKGTNLKYLQQKFKTELVPNIKHNVSDINEQVHQQLLKVCLIYIYTLKYV